MYKIVGRDGKEYGPVTAEQVQQWLAAGRVDARTQAQRDGTSEWKALAEFPELMGPPPMNRETPTDGMAIGSLVCGILSLTVFSILAGIPAIVLGHVSRSAIKRSMGQIKGEGMALAGLIMGYISLAIIPVILLFVATIAIPSFLRSKQAANESSAVANLRTINTAEVTYLSMTGGNFGDVSALIEAGLLDNRFKAPVSGYVYTIVADGTEYTAEARPASTNTARFGYYTTPDSVVRYSFQPDLAPVGQSGMPAD